MLSLGLVGPAPNSYLDFEKIRVINCIKLKREMCKVTPDVDGTIVSIAHGIEMDSRTKMVLSRRLL